MQATIKIIGISIAVLALLIFTIFKLPFITNEAPENTGAETSTNTTTMQLNTPTVTPISHASAVLTWGDTIIYADPVGDAEAFAGQPAPDIVFITHEHGDHFSEETLVSVLTNTSVLILPQAVADKIIERESWPGTRIILANGDQYEHNGITITAIPAYNIRTEALQNHPKGRDNGYVLEKDGTRVYFSGDSEDTPEMRALQNIDIAFIAMNLPYTMDVEHAAEAVLTFKPKQVYPYHYRTPDGFSDVAKFKELVNAGDPDIEVVQLEWYP